MAVGDPLEPDLQRRRTLNAPSPAAEGRRLTHTDAPIDDLSGLEAVTGHRFRDRRLLRAAVAHPSAAPVRTDNPGTSAAVGYERLEFLGDRVLALVVAELLFDRFPDENEGALSRRLVGLVRREALLRVAREIGFGRFLEMAAGPAGRRDLARDTALADGCEALIGALYLDGGIEAARKFIHAAWSPLLDEAGPPPRDAKTALQEWAQARRLPLPAYAVQRREGPPHAPRFLVSVTLPNAAPATGSGTSKRAAEQAAAAALLQHLEGNERG